MLAALERLSEICTRRHPTADDVLEACTLIGTALGADDVYVIRAGDPDFIRIGCPCPASAYEIKQKGYWLIWRELASASSVVACTFKVTDRMVSGGAGLRRRRPASHVAALLACDEASSDMLVIKGDWPSGLPEDHARIVRAARAILSPLVTAVADGDRRARQREQLESLANVADAFNRAVDSEDLLTAIATALAKSSNTDWVTIVTYNDAATAVADRAINLARHSETAAAAAFRGPPRSQRPSEVRIGVELARSGGCILIPDVFAEGLPERPELAVMRDDIPGLQRYWQRAHILSVAILPIVFQGAALGHVSFSSGTGRQWKPEDVEFMRALVAQAATAVKGLSLFRQLEQSREELRQSEERFRSLVQHGSDMITVVGSDGRVSYQSPSSRQILGYDPVAVLGRHFADFLHPDDAGTPLESLVSGGSPSQPGMLFSELRMCHRDGSWRHVECIGTDQRANPSIQGFVLNIRDTSERKRLEQQLRHQAYHDPLTRLVNRREFGERLDEALSAAVDEAQLAVLFLDLDNFKGVNDTLGHEAGDRVLVEVARRLSACVRPGDTVARLGGDEFAVLLRRVQYPEEAEQVATRILDRLQRPLHLAGRELVVGASIGLAGTGSGMDWEDRDALLRSADVAMYSAKAVGKACYRLFEPSMLSSIVERHDLAAELRSGVGSEEFELYYQPVVALGSGELAGLEALVRWHHPRHGLLGPVDFIPVAEDSGAILPLGQWVLAQACLQASLWLRAYPTLGDWTMSVNVSVRQLQQPGFLAGLRGALAAADLDPRYLLLEITESVMADDSRAMLERLREVRALGVRIGLDDFATGYSSLSHLREMPVDLLKIDHCFIADIGAVAPERELVAVILELGRTLGIQVVAEGIERQEQLDRLLSLGCEFGQGYLLGRPLSATGTGDVLAHAASTQRARPAA